MNRRLLLVSALMVPLWLIAATEEYQTIGWGKSWMVYDYRSGMSQTSLHEDVRIGGVTYLRDDYDDNLHYRQEGEKVYCYDAAIEEESLLFDFGLQQGENFSMTEMLNVRVERVCDTTIITPIFKEVIVCRKLYLRGVENPNFADTWIEHIGSVHYGIKRPKTLEGIPEMHLVTGDFVPMTGAYVNDFQQNDVRGRQITFSRSYDTDHNAPSSDLCFRLGGDTLYVSGTLVSDYALMYVIVTEEGSTIHWNLHNLGVQFDSYLSFDFEIAIPGFKQDAYVVYNGEEAIADITDVGITNVTTIGNSFSPYYDLMGRPVANPTRGIYVKDGKKIAVD